MSLGRAPHHFEGIRESVPHGFRLLLEELVDFSRDLFKLLFRSLNFTAANTTTTATTTRSRHPGREA